MCIRDSDLTAVLFSFTGNIYATDRLDSKATSDVDRLVTVCMFHGTSLFTHIVPFHSSSLPAPSPLAGGFDQAGLPCDFARTIIAVFSQAKLLLHPSALLKQQW